MKLLVLVLTTALAALPAAAQICNLPFWQDTLRCRYSSPALPQTNLGPPATVKPFTRVFLTANPSVRCTDGTIPVMYVDRAVGGDTNKWIISMTGGYSTYPRDSNADGIPDDVQHIVDNYAGAEFGSMSTATAPQMKELDGINSEDPLQNFEFATWNRVRVEKCSPDRYMGRASWVAAGGFFTANGSGGAPISFNLYQQGYLIMREALAALRTGLTYTTWTNDPVTGEVVETQDTLPALEDAEKVFFVGHSNAAHGLYHNIDNLVADLHTDPNFAGDVRAMFDANFIPSLENEAAMNTPGADAYDFITSGSTTSAMQTFTYDGALHYPTSFAGQEFSTNGAQLDASCLTAHAAAGDGWKCIDRGHVMLNHIATPFMFREDFTDPNKEHLFNGAYHHILWADPVTTNCPVGVLNCPPILKDYEYRARLNAQIGAILDFSQVDSELATGADPSLGGVGNFPAWAAWMPNCNIHAGAFDDGSFFGTQMNYLTFTHTMNLWTRDFWLGPRTNARSWSVDQWDDGAGNITTTVAGTCP